MPKITRRDALLLSTASAALSVSRKFGYAEAQETREATRNARDSKGLNREAIAFERVTLEMSLKPFRQTDDASIRAVCTELFRQWAPLIRRVNGVAVMLWSADGSEILDYRGRMSDEFEWAKWIGIANPPDKATADDPNRLDLHSTPHLYTENPPRMTYGILAKIVRILKQVGNELTGKPISVGATFDPGPEFARSAFKYKRHPEIANDNTMGSGTFVTCVTRLHADKEAYAAFPKGISEGMSLGTFLGGQSQHFLTDLGFDYLWFSNGFGFAVSPWNVKGPLFDGTKFDAANAPRYRDAIVNFWKDYRRECPSIPIETRGTNLLLGSDLATNACPLQEIYDGNFNMTAPPNSPWAALDGDFGLELVGYLSRIAELPANGRFPFRYYTHDPWWLNSPWFDRYGREPHDIYLPLSLARVDAEAKITRPSFLEFLTVDNSYGQIPEQTANEVTPHILNAMDSFSDAPGVATWLCPFREYHDLVFGQAPNPALAFFADWFLRGAVNSGFPLNTVVSTGHYLSSLKKDPKFFDKTVLVTLLPTAGSPLEESLLARVRQGLPVLFYGPVQHASQTMKDLLGLQITTGIEGLMELETSLAMDSNEHGSTPVRFLHRSLTNAGPVDTIASDRSSVLASVRANGNERTYAVKRGSAVWLRGTFCSSIESGSQIPVPDSAEKFFLAESLLRMAMAQFGYSIAITKPTAASRLPVITAARCRNGYFLSGYMPSSLSRISLQFPLGAPLLLGRETWLEDAHSSYTLPRAWHNEVRLFVEQQEASEVSCTEHYAGMVGFRRRMLVGGLRNATVTFLPEDDGRVVFQANDMRLHIETSLLPVTKSDDGRKLTVRGITGSLLVSW
ncbi:hypothetical protein [Terriglobus tenax]|uniref:hypothetical protein n=1 Tax=Terriglobus tenax TaxID=1111115 RepID=UPI0021E0625F|nr:hypothetical protein [Terriglobus tenax]